jgi:hypothetical protein
MMASKNDDNKHKYAGEDAEEEAEDVPPNKKKMIGDDIGDVDNDNNDSDNGNDDNDDSSSTDDYSSKPEEEVSLEEEMNLPTGFEEELLI